MDPNTGEFHELKPRSIGPTTLTGRLSLPKKQKGPRLHPDHQKLVIAANNKPVPKDWPIFQVSETYVIRNALCRITRITTKDLEFEVVSGATPEKGASCKLQGREFKVRVVRPGKIGVLHDDDGDHAIIKRDVILVRPVVGNVARSL